MAKFNERLQFILDMSDKLTGPATKASKSLKGLGADVVATQKKLAAMNKQAGDISKLAALRGEVERNSKTSKALADKVGSLRVQIAMTEKPTKAMRDSLRAAVKEQTEHGKASDKAKDALYKLDQQLKKAGVDTANLGEAERKARIQAAQLGNELRRQGDALDRATKKQQALTKAKEQYAKAEQQAQKMMAAGGKGMLAGGAMMGGVYGAGSKFTSYDHQLSAVQAVGRLSASDKAQLSGVIEELAAKSSFNANQAAGAAGFMAQAGFGKEEIKEALGPVMQLAAATGSDLTRTADIASNIMGAFQIGADEMPRVADVLTMAANSFNVDLSMLGETMKYLAPVASKLGMSMEEATAMTGLLGNVGIQGSQAGNALKSMAGSLAAPNSKKDKALASIGMKDSDLKDSDGNLRSLPEIMLKLQGKTKGMGNADMTALFKTLFGEEFYGPAMEIVSKGGDVLDKAVKDMYESQGAAAEAERIRLDNLQGDFTKFGSAAEGISIKLGKSMDPIYRKLMGIANGVMEKINKWMQENPKLVKQIGIVVSVLGALLSVSSALLIGLGALWLMMAKGRLIMFLFRTAVWEVIKAIGLKIGAVAKWVAVMALKVSWFVISKTAMAAWVIASKAWTAAVWLAQGAIKALNLVMRLSPMGWILTAVMALAAAAVWLWKNWDNLPEAFAQLWEDIKGFFTGAWDYIKELLGFDPVAAVSQMWDGLGDYFSNLFGGIWDSFMGTFGKIRDTITGSGIAQAMGDGWSWFKGQWSDDPAQNEAINDAPKAGEADPKVNGKPTTKGNQIPVTKPVVNTTNQNTYQITIDAKGLSAQEVAEALDRKMAEAQRLADQKNRGRMND